MSVHREPRVQLLGHDNAIVFREFLGLTEKEYETHVANGVI